MSLVIFFTLLIGSAQAQIEGSDEVIFEELSDEFEDLEDDGYVEDEIVEEEIEDESYVEDGVVEDGEFQDISEELDPEREDEESEDEESEDEESYEEGEPSDEAEEIEEVEEIEEEEELEELGGEDEIEEEEYEEYEEVSDIGDENIEEEVADIDESDVIDDIEAEFDIDAGSDEGEDFADIDEEDEDFLDIDEGDDRAIASVDDYAGLDSPNLELERYLNNVFSKYSDRVDSNAWRELLIEKGVSDIYQIQPGDTMWDISSVLFGSGYYWPKIWQINSSLTNPHFIMSGGSIKFTPGSTEDAPSVDLLTDDGSAQDDSFYTNFSDMDIPPGQESRFSRIPPSLSGSEFNYVPPEKMKRTYNAEADIRSIQSYASNASNIMKGYLTEVRPPSYGKVVGVGSWGTVSTTYQDIFLKARGLNIGETYIVYDDTQTVDHPDRAAGAGNFVNIQGVIKVVEKTDDAKNLFRAKVTKSFSGLKIDSNVGFNEPSLMYDLRQTSSKGNVKSTIVSGLVLERKMIGLHDLVFLDKGEKDGLKVGDMLKIVNNKKFDEETKYESKKTNGVLKVIKTTSGRSTAVVLSALDIISPGDYTEGL